MEGRPKVVFQKTDVTDWAQLEALFDTYAKEIDNKIPDIFVVGAGPYEASTAGFWNDHDEDSHYRLLDVNLIHPIRLTKDRESAHAAISETRHYRSRI